HDGGAQASDVDLFDDRLDALAINLESAFAEADESMLQEEQALRSRYAELQESIRRALRVVRLDDDGTAKLHSRLDALNWLMTLMNEVLRTHPLWQGIHNAVSRVDAFRSLGRFSAELESFRRQKIDGLSVLVEQQSTATLPSAGGDDAIAPVFATREQNL